MAPTTVRLPMLVPGNSTALHPIHTSLHIMIGVSSMPWLRIGIDGLVKAWLNVRIDTWCAMLTSLPIVRGADVSM